MSRTYIENDKFNLWKKELSPYHDEKLLDCIYVIVSQGNFDINAKPLSDGAKEYLLQNFKIDLQQFPQTLSVLIWGYMRNVEDKAWNELSYPKVAQYENSYNQYLFQYLYQIKEMVTLAKASEATIASLIDKEKIDIVSRQINESSQGILSVGISAAPNKSIVNQSIFAFGIPMFLWEYGEISSQDKDKEVSQKLYIFLKDVYDEMIVSGFDSTGLISAVLARNSGNFKKELNVFFENLSLTLQSQYQFSGDFPFFKLLLLIKQSYLNYYKDFEREVSNPFLFFQKGYAADLSDQQKYVINSLRYEDIDRESDLSKQFGKMLDEEIINKEVYKKLSKLCLQLIKINEPNSIPEVNAFNKGTLLVSYAINLFKKQYLLSSEFVSISNADKELRELLGFLHNITMYVRGIELKDLMQNVQALREEVAIAEDDPKLIEKLQQCKDSKIPQKIKSLAEMLLSLKKVFDKCAPDSQIAVEEIDCNVQDEPDVACMISVHYISISQALEELVLIINDAVSLFEKKYNEIKEKHEAAQRRQEDSVLQEQMKAQREKLEEAQRQQKEIQEMIRVDKQESSLRKQQIAARKAQEKELAKNTIVINGKEQVVLDQCHKISNSGGSGDFYIYCEQAALDSSRSYKDQFKSAIEQSYGFAAQHGQNGPKFYSGKVYELKITGNPRIFGSLIKVENKEGKEVNMIYFSKFIENPHGDKNASSRVVSDIERNPPTLQYSDEHEMAMGRRPVGQPKASKIQQEKDEVKKR